MYGYKSDYLMNLETGYTFGRRAYTPTSLMHARVMTTASTDNNGTGSVEATGGNYEPFEITNGTDFWGEPAGGLCSNLLTLRMIKLLGVSFGKIPEIQFWDLATGGNILYGIRFALAEQQEYNENGTIEWEPGQLTIGQAVKAVS